MSMTNEEASNILRLLAAESLEGVSRIIESEKNRDLYKRAYEMAIKSLEESVPVVRCKDCKHWDDVSITEKGHECNLTNGNKYKIRIATPSDWFCPMGERRSE